MAAINITTSIPGKVPISFYTNIASFGEAWMTSEHGNYYYDRVSYEAGLQITILRDMVMINFPIFASEKLSDWNQTNTDNYFQRVRFVIDFNKYEPFTVLKDIIM